MLMIMMMARPIVTQEAWKNDHHADNAEEDDGDDQAHRDPEDMNKWSFPQVV